ncbi:MAG: SAM-dependent methyltransferase [Bacteroidales bacterium]|jgi:16S rRNA (cytidine1402-2'-O)-methyltransferase|nr:SAM-dependent methyltransferase [Bacteroidales bacterium]
MSTNKTIGTLFLIPAHLGEANYDYIFPSQNSRIISSCTHFIAENIRTARRGIKSLCPSVSIDSLTFVEFNKNTKPKEIPTIMKPLLSGIDMGIISEAGMPCIADPGNLLVEFAHQHSIRVHPLIGPNSILLALIASGFNGQQFTFHGYIPIKEGKRQFIQKIEQYAAHSGYTQIFMETPYRNQKLLDDLLQTLKPKTKLCIACDITLSSEYIHTQTVEKWKTYQPNLHKRPCIFLIQ